MGEDSLYDILGLPKNKAEEIARKVRDAFSQSKTAREWVERLIEEFVIEPQGAEIFACGWFAGRYAGVSEVFKVVQMEMDKLERGQGGKESSFADEGYA